MEMGEDDRNKVELIHVALQQLMDERKKNKGKGRSDQEEEEGEGLLISRLLSQLASLENDGSATLVSCKDSSNCEEPSSSTSKLKACETKEVGMDEVVRELRSVKRQNLITHCLLSVMIVITAFWQFQEVSFLLAVREKLCHPLRAVGDLIKGSLKGRATKPLTEASPLPPVSVAELPHVDLPTLTFKSNNEE